MDATTIESDRLVDSDGSVANYNVAPVVSSLDYCFSTLRVICCLLRPAGSLVVTNLRVLWISHKVSRINLSELYLFCLVTFDGKPV